jgi:hypothetical protein
MGSGGCRGKGMAGGPETGSTSAPTGCGAALVGTSQVGYICAPDMELHASGRLAQLVQSTCLTSRGSGVRIPQRPLCRPDKLSGLFAFAQSICRTHRSSGHAPLGGAGDAGHGDAARPLDRDALARHSGTVPGPAFSSDPRDRQARAWGLRNTHLVRYASGAVLADAVCQNVRLIRHATSLGGGESTMERRAAILGQGHRPPSLLRLSVGIEEADDLWADLDSAITSAAP